MLPHFWGIIIQSQQVWCPSKISFPIAKISDEQDEQSQQRPRQHQHPAAVPFPGNKRSRLDVTIGHPGPAEHFQINPQIEANNNTTSEEFSQPRSMSYYEVPTHRNTISARPPALPPVPPPSQGFPYSQIDRSPTTMQSRLIWNLNWNEYINLYLLFPMISFKRSIFQTFWKVHCCAKFVFFELSRDFNFWLLAYF